MSLNIFFSLSLFPLISLPLLFSLFILCLFLSLAHSVYLSRWLLDFQRMLSSQQRYRDTCVFVLKRERAELNTAIAMNHPRPSSLVLCFYFLLSLSLSSLTSLFLFLSSSSQIPHTLIHIYQSLYFSVFSSQIKLSLLTLMLMLHSYQPQNNQYLKTV